MPALQCKRSRMGGFAQTLVADFCTTVGLRPCGKKYYADGLARRTRTAAARGGNSSWVGIWPCARSPANGTGSLEAARNRVSGAAGEHEGHWDFAEGGAPFVI